MPRKALLRQYTWFTNVYKAKEEIEACLLCQENGPTNPLEPLLSPEIPEGPWLELLAVPAAIWRVGLHKQALIKTIIILLRNGILML